MVPPITSAQAWDSAREIASVFLAIIMTGGLPFIISLLKAEGWSPARKNLLALACSVAVGSLTILVNGNVSFANLTDVVTAVFTTSTVIYHQWVKGTGIDQQLTEKTLPWVASPASPPTQPPVPPPPPAPTTTPTTQGGPNDVQG
jgi:hypothetical protein